MEDLKKLPFETLVDMLAGYTADFTRIRKTGATRDEYNKTKLLINLLTAEIETRKQQDGGSSAYVDTDTDN